MSLGTVLLTGVGRERGTGAGLALGLAEAGWDLVLSYLGLYDERVGYEQGPADPERVADRCMALGRTVSVIPGDLGDPDVPARLLEAANGRGDLTALVMAHTESVDSSIFDTTVESWDRHYAVNARAVWLLVKAFAEQLPPSVSQSGSGRIVALTSDHTAHNLPYGSSKGALDRIVVAASIELAGLGVRANVINPGPIDTGWMTDDMRRSAMAQTPLGRLGTPRDTADLVTFLLSPEGGWITGQVLYSNGGFRAAQTATH